MAISTFSSCSTQNLVVSSVDYQSIRTDFAQPTSIPENAEIGMVYYVDNDGYLSVFVKNLTSEVLTIDKTKTFFINTNGSSTSYYDPKVTTHSTTNYTSGTKGAAVNLGSVAAAMGVGGRVGHLLNGVTATGATTSGTTQTNTTYIQDQPILAIGPKGEENLGHIYNILGVGNDMIKNREILSKEMSSLKFSVSVSYSIDGGKTYRQLTTPFYVSSSISVPVANGKVNDAFAKLYSTKPDALAEPMYFIRVAENAPATSVYRYGALVDFQ